jgi:hypothetical protein
VNHYLTAKLQLMSNGRNPKRKNIDSSRDAGGFIALPWSVIDCPAYRRLSLIAKCLLVEVARQYCKDNNGRMLLSRAYMSKRGWMSNDTISKAKLELTEAGFIYQTVMGHRPNRASWYAITWYSLDRLVGYDVGAETGFLRGAYLKNPPLKNASLTPSHGTEKPHIVPLGGTRDQRLVPPHGTIRTCIDASPTPPHGHHLEKPSIATNTQRINFNH